MRVLPTALPVLVLLVACAAAAQVDRGADVLAKLDSLPDPDGHKKPAKALRKEAAKLEKILLRKADELSPSDVNALMATLGVLNDAIAAGSASSEAPSGPTFGATRSTKGKKEKSKRSAVSEVVAVSEACAKSVLETVPPDFCWKGDWGVLPSDCPAGFRRELALCVKECDPGFSYSWGVCKEDCRNGWDTLLLRCRNPSNWFDFYWREHRFPERILNYDDRVQCPPGKYKAGSLCYEDCTQFEAGLVNCGIGACSTSERQCKQEVWDLFRDLLDGVVDLADFVLSVGGANSTLSDFISDPQRAEALLQEFDDAADALGRMGGQTFFERALDKAMAELESGGRPVSQDEVIEICEPIISSGYNAIVNAGAAPPSANSTMWWEDVLVALDTCAVASQDDCVAGIVDALELWDPTGLVGLASAFVRPSCPRYN